MAKTVKIGGGHAHFEDTMDGYRGLLESKVDYIICDFLAELSMAMLGKDKNASPDGFSLSFLRDFRPWLKPILENGTKLVTNWGGINPKGAGEALKKLAAELGLNPKIAVVEGDDLRGHADELRARGLRDMFNGDTLPEGSKIASINAYFGAFPIASALAAGADIVLTGRVVDSALTLGALIHEFGWTPKDYDRLAAGTLAGHLLECSSQVTGGTFTDWAAVEGWENIGKPIAECSADGRFVLTKPKGSGGLVSAGTVAEQMIYEVGDPQAYIVPDVACDFSQVKLEEIGPDRVSIQGVKGHGAPAQYKVCTIYDEGWRGRVYMTIFGPAAAAKARRQAQAVFERTNRMLRDRNAKPLNDARIELMGAESTFGPRSRQQHSREVVAMLTVDHDERQGVEIFLKEQLAAATSWAPGTSLNILNGTGTGAVPRVKLFSFLLPKSEAAARVTMGDKSWEAPPDTSGGFDPAALVRPPAPPAPKDADPKHAVPLVALAWTRSGDKGDLFNVGVFARRPDYFPYIAAALTPETVRDWYAHLLDKERPQRVDRFVLPGTNGLNFIVHNSLGGGACSAHRFDPMGKGMGQNLLEIPIPVSAAIAKAVSADLKHREAEYEELLA